MDTSVKPKKFKRGVDTSPLVPGEKELLERTLKKILAARAEKETQRVPLVDTPTSAGPQ